MNWVCANLPRYDIDRALAWHYGFTEEELDFILNYDIKYRLGRETEDEEEAAK